ncbi:hypothetical protein B0H11DRAFT_2419488 [Mycena galericulata]|nr:hypothetical protein B0H11DRAFT_2419488 [Mycena galericulata]
MDAAELESIVVGLQNVAATRYVTAAGFVVLLYDHLLTLDAEVRYIWSAPTSLAKVLFLIMRVMVPIFLAVQITCVWAPPFFIMECAESVHSSIKAPDYSDTEIGVQGVDFRRAQTYAGWLSIVISNFLVLMRIWTTLPDGHKLRACCHDVDSHRKHDSHVDYDFFYSIYLMYPSAVLIFDPLVGLCTFSSKPNIVWLWVAGLVYEVIVFVTLFWNTLDRPRAMGTDTAITRVLIRDGIVYFLLLSGLRVANTVIAAVSPVSSLFIIVFSVWAGTTLVTSRLILNARRAAGKPTEATQLQMTEAQNSDQCQWESTWYPFPHTWMISLPRLSRRPGV